MNIAFITARAGSKRLKNKNVKLFNKLPLIEHTLQAALLSNCYDKIIVSSDDLKIKKILNKYRKHKNLTFLKRPKFLSGDKIKVLKVINYYFKKLKIIEKYKTISLLLPTCPLRNQEHIKKSFQIFKKKKLNGLISITEIDFVYKMTLKINKKNLLKPFWDNSPLISGNTRSQDHKKVYRPNGGLYLSDTRSFSKTKNFFKQAKLGYIVLDKVHSLDVDTEEDFKIAETVSRFILS